MDPKRWEHVKTLYDEARARPATDRAAFLAHACLGDTDLERDVQTLLDQPLSTDSFVSMVGGPSSTLVAQAVAEHHAPLTGRRIGTFEVKALLGRGGMGEVYRAHDTKLGRVPFTATLAWKNFTDEDDSPSSRSRGLPARWIAGATIRF